MLVFYSNI